MSFVAVLFVLAVVGMPAAMAIGWGSFIFGAILSVRLVRRAWVDSVRPWLKSFLLAMGVLMLVVALFRPIVILKVILLFALLLMPVVGVAGGLGTILRSAWPVRLKVATLIGLMGIVSCQLPVFLEQHDRAGASQGAAFFTCVWLGAWTIAVGTMFIFTPPAERKRLQWPLSHRKLRDS